MYNIHSHYENIFAFIKTIIKDPVLIYFYPFGSISYDNIEMMHCNGDGSSPIVFCFDQEPIIQNFENLIVKLGNNFSKNRHIIILNTEPGSQIKNSIISKLKSENYLIRECSYFFHIFAAADWYRGFRFNTEIVDPAVRKISKKYITFNRITGNSRAYRGIFVADLIKKQLLEHGHVSFSHVCPEHGEYSKSALDLITKHNVDQEIVYDAITTLNSINYNLRIDQVDQPFINNSSQTISCIPQLMESFLYVVTETCFWEEKKHLTEKIFKPIVSKHPFILLGCRGNLQYLKSYGFRTFDKWWDESYDNIKDPIERLHAVTKIIETICSYDNAQLEKMLIEMQDTLEYNFDLFYSKSLIDTAWNELTTNLRNVVPRYNLKLG
jgi:hypothetical protein